MSGNSHQARWYFRWNEDETVMAPMGNLGCHSSLEEDINNSVQVNSVKTQCSYCCRLKWMASYSDIISAVQIEQSINVSRSARFYQSSGHRCHACIEVCKCVAFTEETAWLYSESSLQITGWKEKIFLSSKKQKAYRLLKFHCPPQRTGCNKYILTSNRTAWV